MPLICALVLACLNPQAIVLKYKFFEGTSHRYQVKVTTDLTVGAQPDSKPMKMVTDIVMKQSVTKVAPDGTATVETEIEQQASTLNGAPNSSDVLTPGKKWVTKIAPTGENSGNVFVPGALGVGMVSMQVANMLPKSPVEPGRHWNSSGSVGDPAVATFYRGEPLGEAGPYNTLEKVSEGESGTRAYIHSSGSVDMSKPPKAATIGGQGAPKLSGVLKFDAHTVFSVTQGLLDEFTNDGSFTMEVSVPTGPKGLSERKRATGTQNLTVKLLDKSVGKSSSSR